MLQKLNERIQGVVAWVIIVLVALTFALFGVNYYIQAHHESLTEVDVNGQPISKQDFDLNLRRTRQFNNAAQLTAEGEKQLKKRLLDDMILNRVSVQAAQSNGFSVSPAQTDAAILTIPQFQEDGQFSADRYQQALSAAYYTADSFQKEVKQGMLLNQQRFAFIGTAFALSSDVERFIKLYMQTRDYDYLTIGAATFVNQTQVTDQDVKAYYDKHPEEFFTPEKVSIDFLRLSMHDLRTKVKLPEDQIKRYYDENQSGFQMPAQWHVAHILFAVPPAATAVDLKKAQDQANQVYAQLKKNPEKFSALVKQYSADKISAMNHGELPWITAGQSELDKDLVNLTTPEVIAEPVKTEHGFEIFKLIAYKPTVIKPFEEVKQEIQEQLTLERVQNEYAHAIEQLTDLSYQSPDSLAPAAQALNLTVEHSLPFSREGGTEPFTKNQDVINAAFSHDVSELDNNSEPVQVDSDTVIVLRVNKHMPSVKRSIEEVKQIVLAKLTNTQAQTLAKQLGEKLLDPKLNPDDLEKLIAEKHLQWNSTKKSARDANTQISSTINEAAFNLPKPGTKTGVTLDNGDYAVIRLVNINDGNPETLDKERMASITQQLEANYGMMDYQLYVSGLMHNAKITHDEDNG